MPRLRELAAIGLKQQRQVRILGCPLAESPLQQDLAWCAGQQVATADDLRDTLQLIVHDHGQVIGKKTIPPSNHEIPRRVVAIFAHRALQAIFELNQGWSSVGAKAQRMRALACVRIAPAGAWINEFLARLERLGGEL